MKYVWREASNFPLLIPLSEIMACERERPERTSVSQRKYRNLACLFDCYIGDIMCTSGSTAVNH